MLCFKSLCLCARPNRFILIFDDHVTSERHRSYYYQRMAFPPQPFYSLCSMQALQHGVASPDVNICGAGSVHRFTALSAPLPPQIQLMTFQLLRHNSSQADPRARDHPRDPQLGSDPWVRDTHFLLRLNHLYGLPLADPNGTTPTPDEISSDDEKWPMSTPVTIHLPTMFADRFMISNVVEMTLTGTLRKDSCNRTLWGLNQTGNSFFTSHMGHFLLL
jgi:hypothetical protein